MWKLFLTLLVSSGSITTNSNRTVSLKNPNRTRGHQPGSPTVTTNRDGQPGRRTRKTNRGDRPGPPIVTDRTDYILFCFMGLLHISSVLSYNTFIFKRYCKKLVCLRCYHLIYHSMNEFAVKLCLSYASQPCCRPFTNKRLF